MKKYLYFCGVFFIMIMVVPAAFSFIPILYAYSTGEYLSVKDVANKQLSSRKKIIYGQALLDSTRNYKLHMLKKTNPKIIVFGDSRVMQFKSYMFTKKFYNMGGVMQQIDEGLAIAPKIIEEKPDLVIIGANIRWFNRHPDEKSIFIHDERLPGFHSKDIVKIFTWVINGDLSFKEMYHQIVHEDDHIGIRGIKGDGFAPDGSYYQTRIITGEKPPNKPLERVVIHGNGRFNMPSGYTSYVALTKIQLSPKDQQINKFIKLIEIFKSNNIKVIVFFPPYSPYVNTSMTELKDKYSWVEKLMEKLQTKKVDFINLNNASSINSNSCEFVDGGHGGEITYMRILIKFIEHYSYLHNFIDKGKLKKLIDKNSGLVQIFDSDITSKPEIDFLGIGCIKHTSALL